jgi:hypothetical protein
MTIKPKKQTIETIKTVTIAVLVTAVIAFIAGVQYQESRQHEIDTAVDNAVQSAPLK